VSSVEQEVERAPTRRVLNVAAAVASTVAARWRGILLTHIFLITIWAAVQLFLFVGSAFAYLHENVPVWVEKIVQIQPLHRPKPLQRYTSYAPTTNCWRDRYLEGDCFGRAEPYRQLPPARWRIREPPPPCGRYYMC
jgi:hypothetical protein